MTSMSANPRWCFHRHASEAQSWGSQRDSSQLDAISLSGAQLLQPSHLTHDGQTQRAIQAERHSSVIHSRYLASRAWASWQRQFETAEASFPGKDRKKKTHTSDKEQTKGEGEGIYFYRNKTFNRHPYQRVTSCVWWELPAYKRGWMWGMKSEGC